MNLGPKIETKLNRNNIIIRDLNRIEKNEKRRKYKGIPWHNQRNIDMKTRGSEEKNNERSENNQENKTRKECAFISKTKHKGRERNKDQH